jgi:hypothetical protein
MHEGVGSRGELDPTYGARRKTCFARPALEAIAVAESMFLTNVQVLE